MSRIIRRECNQTTFDWVKERLFKPNHEFLDMGNFHFDGVQLLVNEKVARGFKPVYSGAEPRWPNIPCCPMENRSFSGGCTFCGDPCI